MTKFSLLTVNYQLSTGRSRLLLLLEHIGAHAAEGALVILGQLLALVDVAADGADKLFHDKFLLNIILEIAYEWERKLDFSGQWKVDSYGIPSG